MKEQTLKDWILKYVETFNQSFPIFMLRGKSDDELISIIKAAIETHVPYVPEDPDPDVDY